MLPKNFEELIKAGDIAALKAAFDECELDARGGYDKRTALHFRGVPEELARWLVGQGLDVNTVTNTYKKTPLHEQAFSSDTVKWLLELGADIEATDSSGNTPLHDAAGLYHRADTVQTLIVHGANIHAENCSKETPLSYALARCANIDICETAEVAALLLGVGAKITPDMSKSIRRIGKDFEFHRENFNKDYLAETDAGLARLYELFDVEAVAERRTHDGVLPIIVTATKWQDQHQELWELLVPSQGAAKTVQGEVIRITGRVSDEMHRNGGINWDADYRKMLDALLRYLAIGAPPPRSILRTLKDALSRQPATDALLSAEELAEAAALVAAIRPKGEGEDEPRRLCELAVKWVLANPNPIPLEKPDYKR
ncbi:MAG: ankyrin repeat domain-containing protein [Proteobacteria bacterium]|nr:ankyrin repeat domain-containing protein [Pseudomonadota bacterium]